MLSLFCLIFIIALCVIPLQPPNSLYENVPSHGIEGSKLTFKCNHGFRPSHLITSVCTDDAKWYPYPREDTCIKVIGTRL